MSKCAGPKARDAYGHHRQGGYGPLPEVPSADLIRPTRAATLRAGMPICWVHQAAAGVAAVRKPGRVMGFMAGGVRICVFDEEINAWAYPVVKPITLRNIDPAAMAALEGFERRVPAAGLE